MPTSQLPQRRIPLSTAPYLLRICRPPVLELKRNENDFAPSADEVARRAYFAYENEGSPRGRDVQHWLAAEAQLIAERNLTRVHGFHNRT